MSLHALDRMADAIERLAFQMPAPNEWTPQFVALAVAAREQANELRRTVALAGGGEDATTAQAGAELPELRWLIRPGGDGPERVLQYKNRKDDWEDVPEVK